MVTKQELKSLKWFGKDIKRLQEEIAELNSVLVSPKTSKISAEPRGGGNGIDKVTTLLARKMELKKIYEKHLVKRLGLHIKILVELGETEMASELKQIIHLRYIQGLKWESIAKELGYSVQQTFKLHGDALAILRKK